MREIREKPLSALPRSKGLMVCLLLGFALVCATNLLCFFPQTLLQAPPEVYRLYNLSTALSIVGGSLGCMALALCRGTFPEKGVLALGYLFLAFGMTLFFFVGDGTTESIIVVTGIFTGLGVGLLMISWFSFLALMPERSAMLTQGGQALLGTLIFVFMIFLFPHYSFVAALVCLLISAVLATLILQKTELPKASLAPFGSLKKSLQTFFTKGNLGPSFAGSLFAFVVVSLLFGIITAVIMSPLSNTNALEQSVGGGLIGASVFLVWAFASKKRNYNFVTKSFFAIFAFVLILPLEGHGIITAIGYQLICLLFFSLVIDTFSSQRRTLLFVLSLAYAAMRGLFLAGLYLPGRFGVYSYQDFFDSASLLFFLVYLVFIALLFILNRERISTPGRRSDSGKGLAFNKRLSGGDVAAAQEQGGSFFSEDDEKEVARGFISRDIHAASEALGKRNGLTKREIEVLGYLARGRDVAFIGTELFLSRNTVKSYAKTIYGKLNVHSRQELIDAVDQEMQLKISGASEPHNT